MISDKVKVVMNPVPNLPVLSSLPFPSLYLYNNPHIAFPVKMPPVCSNVTSLFLYTVIFALTFSSGLMLS